MATPQPTAEAPLKVLRFSETYPINPRAVAEHFGRNLWRERRRADLSQEELGVRATLHRTEISLLERGGRVPRIDTLIKLAGGLDCEPEALLAGITWTPGIVRTGRFIKRRHA